MNLPSTPNAGHERASIILQLRPVAVTLSKAQSWGHQHELLDEIAVNH
jgi:hypothetical protein